MDEKIKRVKKNGEIFTPRYIVEDILDSVGYEKNILDKHIIDNSCGDGGFLKIILERYLNEARANSFSVDDMKNGVEKYIHGIELDKLNYKNCISNMNDIAEHYGLTNVKWDIINAPTQTIDVYDGLMDYVVGNPPYVRVHNLDDSFDMVKEHSFCQDGMTDLFYLFYELSFKMLNKNGKLGYITPNSLYNSLAGTAFRKYINDNRTLYRITDVGHHQPFTAMTYTTILSFDNSKKFEKIDYYKYSIEGSKKYVTSIKYDDLFVNNNILLTSNNEKYREILLFKPKKKYVEVKNGFATLNDGFFISKKFDFDECVIDVIKGSTGEWKKCFYPYDTQGKIIPFENFKSQELIDYISSNEGVLKKRSLEKNSTYYSFGRTQAINDTYKNKISINTTIKDVNSLKINTVPSGKGVYSGLYIVSDYSTEIIKNILKTTEFIDYIASLNKCKSGGYYTFSSKDLALYLNYQIEQLNK